MHTILVADSDEMELELFRTILTREGYNVILTADGPQAVELYRTRRPSLALIDSVLPSMSGEEVMQQIKEFDEKAKVILIR